MSSLQVNLGPIALKNPIIPASGTFGFGEEMASFYDMDCLGAISFKGTTREARYGNPLPRIAECGNYGMINAVGLQNPGIDEVMKKQLPMLERLYAGPIIANVSGFSVDDYRYVCGQLDTKERVSIIEVNISCPNVHNGGMAFGTTAQAAAEVTRAVRQVTGKPIYIKLSPNVTDITTIALACVEAGADGLCLINTVLGMRIDIRRRQPVLTNRYGGYSGRGIFPIALRMVNQVATALRRKGREVPIIGCGGIETAEDVVEMMMAGATAVEVGAANLHNPMACPEIIDRLPAVLEEIHASRIKEIIGCCLDN